MGYVQKGSLTALFDPKSVAPVGRQIARDAGQAMTAAAADLTPKRTGHTAEQWRPLGVEHVELEDGGQGWQSGATNPSHVMRWLEHGVAPHDVRPKGGDAQALNTPEGPRASAHHPGFGGAHVVPRAEAVVLAELPALAQPTLSSWAAALEASADSGAKAKP